MRKFEESLTFTRLHLSVFVQKGPNALTHIQDIYFEGCFTQRDYILSTEYYPAPRPDEIMIGHLERLFNDSENPPNYIVLGGGLWNVFNKDLNLVWPSVTKLMMKLRKVR